MGGTLMNDIKASPGAALGMAIAVVALVILLFV
jgi:preprotein translocase subunit Sec61beta